MAKLRELQTVDGEYATSGPNANTIVQSVAKPAGSLFRCLADGPAWKEWLGIDVEWTSPEPFGIGTTRTVMARGQRIDETFLAWEEGRRLCFRFDRTTLPVKAFAEDYVIDARSDGSCELHWHYAYEWDGPLSAVSGRLFAAIFARNGKKALANLAQLVESTTRFD